MNYKIQKLELDKHLIYFIAISEKLEVIGKCGFNIRDNETLGYQDTFVNEEYRASNIYKELFKARQRYVDINFPNSSIEAYCIDENVKLFLSENFEITDKLNFCNRDNKSIKVTDKVVNDFWVCN